jgi:hypothetical protein
MLQTQERSLDNLPALSHSEESIGHQFEKVRILKVTEPSAL